MVILRKGKVTLACVPLWVALCTLLSPPHTHGAGIGTHSRCGDGVQHLPGMMETLGQISVLPKRPHGRTLARRYHSVTPANVPVGARESCRSSRPGSHPSLPELLKHSAG